MPKTSSNIKNTAGNSAPKIKKRLHPVDPTQFAENSNYRKFVGSFVTRCPMQSSELQLLVRKHHNSTSDREHRAHIQCVCQTVQTGTPEHLCEYESRLNTHLPNFSDAREQT